MSPAAKKDEVEGKIVQVAVSVPLRRLFDYHLSDRESVRPGMRVEVSLGKKTQIGIVVKRVKRSQLATKSIIRVLDSEPALQAPELKLMLWAAAYYQHPIGEVLLSALPADFRKPVSMTPPTHHLLCLSQPGRRWDPKILNRAPLQRAVMELVAATPEGVELGRLKALSSSWRTPVKALEARGWVEFCQQISDESAAEKPEGMQPAPPLSEAQRSAVDSITEGLDHFGAFLLHGVTGSGKTEVYLQCAREVIARGRQVLIMVPEIALVPQLALRVKARLGVTVAQFHSGMTPAARRAAWWSAKMDKASIVLGTRSAVFTSLARPGLIVVDEEHDPSYKQQDGFRYHARDVAVMRARAANIPIILGSATPALETEANHLSGRYRRLTLPARPGSAELPVIHLLDLGKLPLDEGLTPPLVQAIKDRLERSEQSLIFINRRGFAPLVRCNQCGWEATCLRCDARLTHHRPSRRLHCHHCGGSYEKAHFCPACEAESLVLFGQGTQRIEETLQKKFPSASVVRIDRDATMTMEALASALDKAHSGQAEILVGTQMLSKGHDFPGVTLVGILDVDRGFYSLDFRAQERLYQTVTQVGGRSGRAERTGEVFIQSAHPESAYLQKVQAHDHQGYVELALAERQVARFPPYSHLVLVRASAQDNSAPLEFLHQAWSASRPLVGRQKNAVIVVMEPVPSPMERRAGRWRAQLLVQASQRGLLHQFLGEWVQTLEKLPAARRVRWSVDVDPVDMT